MGAIIHIGCMFLSHHTVTVHIHECIALELMFLKLQGDSSQQGLEGHCDMKKEKVSNVPKIKSEGCSQQEKQTWFESLFLVIPKYSMFCLNARILTECINLLHGVSILYKAALNIFINSRTYVRMYITRIHSYLRVLYTCTYVCVCTYFTSTNL